VLSSIKATNFLSWKELHFNVTKGATLVDGWNEDDQRSEGSGKSAILNAVSWCIFGKVPKDANIDDVIKDGETSCSVVLEFDNGDAIVRSRKPHDLYIMKAGATIKGKDARETQTFIEEYIGCNFETFCQSVYFAQNYDKKFLSSNQEDKGKILSSIQNLQVFDKARKEVMDLLKLENDKITKLKNQLTVEENNFNNLNSQKTMLNSFIADKIKKHKEQQNMLTQQRDMVSGHVKRTESDMEAIVQKASAIDLQALANDEAELNKAKADYGTQLSGVTYQKSQVDSVKKAIQSKEFEGQTLATKYSNLEKKLQTSKTTKSPRILSLETNRDFALDLNKNQSRNRLLTKVKQLEDFIANPTKICPSCGTELASADTSHSQKELESIRQEITQIEAQAKDQAAQYDIQIQQELQNNVTEQESMAAEMQSILAQLEAVSQYLDQNKIPSMDELNKQEVEIRGVITQIDQAIFQTNQKKNEHAQLVNQHGTLSNQLANYNQQLQQLQNSLNQLGEPDVSQDTAKLAALDLEVSNVTVKIEELKNLIEVANIHAQRLETLKEGFKEIKTHVFTNALKELNHRTNEYLSQLFDMEATVKFTTEDQKIESKIVLDGKERSLGLLSGGQNRRFNLAVDLAISDLVSNRKSSKLGILIFDEYFKDLSEISMEKSLDLLKDRKCPVVLIEHNSIFKNIVDNTFFVRLEDGTSRESRP